MPGVRKGNNFYFDMVADSGIHATYTYGMCEKDHEYCDHLSTMLSQYYDVKDGERTVSQFHKHPPGFTVFSKGDAAANNYLAKQYNGVINGLILVDPEFHVSAWYIDEKGRQTPAVCELDDEAVRKEMPRKDLSELKKSVEQQEQEKYFFRTGMVLGKRQNMQHMTGKIGQKNIAVKVLEQNQDLDKELRILSNHFAILGSNLPDGSVALRVMSRDRKKRIMIKIQYHDGIYEVVMGDKKMEYHVGKLAELVEDSIGRSGGYDGNVKQ